MNTWLEMAPNCCIIALVVVLVAEMYNRGLKTTAIGLYCEADDVHCSIAFDAFTPCTRDVIVYRAVQQVRVV